MAMNNVVSLMEYRNKKNPAQNVHTAEEMLIRLEQRRASDKSDVSFEERLERIRASIARIDKLMADLRSGNLKD
jgi:hypothetical protein